MARQPSGGADIALVGSTAGHPLVLRALTEIRPRTSYGPTVDDGTGAAFLDRILAEFPEVEPVPGVFDAGGYAIHHYDRSAREADTLRAAVRDAQRRLLVATEDARQWRAKAEEAEALARAGPRRRRRRALCETVDRLSLRGAKAAPSGRERADHRTDPRDEARPRSRSPA